MAEPTTRESIESSGATQPRSRFGRIGRGTPSSRATPSFDDALASTDRRPVKGLPRDQDPIVRALGWLSVALGAIELIAPRQVARAIGMRGDGAFLRVYGVREIASGVGLLSERRTPAWMWSRVAGDALDLATLAVGFGAPAASRGRVAAALTVVAGVTALDVATARRLDRVRSSRRGELRRDGSIRVEHTVTINRTRDECYRAWRDFERLPRFMHHLEAVRVLSSTRSHWIAKAPAGQRVEWDAEITHDQPGEWIAWRSVDASDVRHAGAVRFVSAPGGRGTVVSVAMQYRPPFGTAGALAAKLFGEEPEQQVREDLRRFKRVLETGEIPTTEGQPSGRRSPFFRLMAKVNPS